MCREAPNAATMQPSACFHYASPAFPIQKTHSPHPILHSHKAPFGVCVFVITWLIPTCLCDATGVHTPIETGKKRSVYCKLVKRKKDSHRFPLWPDFQLETRGLTPCVPEEKGCFVHSGFRKGFFTNGTSQRMPDSTVVETGISSVIQKTLDHIWENFYFILNMLQLVPPRPQSNLSTATKTQEHFTLEQSVFLENFWLGLGHFHFGRFNRNYARFHATVQLSNTAVPEDNKF